MRIKQRSRMCFLTIPDTIQIKMSTICKNRITYIIALVIEL